jgi:hypothetical protein
MTTDRSSCFLHCNTKHKGPYVDMRQVPVRLMHQCSRVLSLVLTRLNCRDRFSESTVPSPGLTPSVFHRAKGFTVPSPRSTLGLIGSFLITARIRHDNEGNQGARRSGAGELRLYPSATSQASKANASSPYLREYFVAHMIMGHNTNCLRKGASHTPIYQSVTMVKNPNYSL